jgi:hypothetical protein
MCVFKLDQKVRWTLNVTYRMTAGHVADCVYCIGAVTGLTKNRDASMSTSKHNFEVSSNLPAAEASDCTGRGEECHEGEGEHSFLSTGILVSACSWIENHGGLTKEAIILL